MAVTERIELVKFEVPAIMLSIRGVASEQVTPVLKDKIYVAVGKDVKENQSRLDWTVHQLGDNFRICIIHVLVPSRRFPMGGLGAGVPVSSVNEIVLKKHRENKRINMHKLLDNYLLVCEQKGVQAEKEYIESDSVEKGIVELIRLHGIRKLVMGAASDNRYFKYVQEQEDMPTWVMDLFIPHLSSS